VDREECGLNLEVLFYINECSVIYGSRLFGFVTLKTPIKSNKNESEGVIQSTKARYQTRGSGGRIICHVHIK
jgi:hypothetical protein